MDSEILKYLYDIKDAASATSAPYHASSSGFACHTYDRPCLLNR